MYHFGRDGGAPITRPRPWFVLCVLLLLVLCSCKTCFSVGIDTLSRGENLTVSSTLISKNNTFELGFFSKGDYLANIYLGIWYKTFKTKTIVWVANRDTPLSDPSSSRLTFSEDGNLILLHISSKIPLWTTNSVLPSPNSSEAVLLDDGNFVLRNSVDSSIVYWQSFDHPTDTWLPGAKLGINKLTGKIQRLISWKSSEDPSSGMFSLQIDPNGAIQYTLEWNMSRTYWSSGVWNGEKFSLLPGLRLNHLFNFSFVSNERESYLTYSLYNNYNDVLSRLVMHQSGQLTQLTFLSSVWGWNLSWAQPRSENEIYAICGPFGIYSTDNSSSRCECLQGFEPYSIDETQLDGWSAGCVRKSRLQCGIKSSKGKNDQFLKIHNLIFPDNSKAISTKNAKSCKSACLQNCSCTAYAFTGNGCSIWEAALLNLQVSDGYNTEQSIYLKLASSEFNDSGGEGNRKKVWLIISILVPLTVLISGFFLWYLLRRKPNQTGIGWSQYSSEDVLLFDFDVGSYAIDHKTSAESNLTRRKKDVELPFFSFESVAAATGGFSSANRLGEGGFGPVYRGQSLRGQEIAVKRLSKRSGQGLEEFRNETILIAKLQHRNLVRLLGCCIEQDENILIYEFMPNKSLDFFLFDPDKRGILNMNTRIHIIEGIAQGLLYLHQYSRLRIIHRDLKASNILLDSEMNPKISDFGMARMFEGNESQANTNRIVGTYGYMAPEYAMEGRFSIKSDVFSFGVLLLEIVSGKRNTGFHHTNFLNLLGHAWDLWNADQGMDLVDPVLGSASDNLMLLRYIKIGLLCVQECQTDRPTTSEVVSMLGNGHTPLPTPKRPAFSTGHVVTDTNSSQNGGGTWSVNEVTISAIQAR